MTLKFTTEEGEQNRASSLVAQPGATLSETGDRSVATAAHEPRGLTTLLAVAAEEASARKWLPLAAVAGALQITLATASPNRIIGTLCLAAGAFTILFVIVRFREQYRRTTEALARTDDVRMVGPLVDRLRYGRKRRRTRRVVREALIRLLPKLRASDAGLLSAEQHRRLARTLGHLGMLGRDVALQLAILGAYRQIGGIQALPVVERLAHNRSRSTNRQRVREAAEECLPFLRERAEHDRSRITLLRAAAGALGEGDLLRPAEGAARLESDQLLRATTGEESEGEG
jgi:hypothetical protein